MTEIYGSKIIIHYSKIFLHYEDRKTSNRPRKINKIPGTTSLL